VPAAPLLTASSKYLNAVKAQVINADCCRLDLAASEYLSIVAVVPSLLIVK